MLSLAASVIRPRSLRGQVTRALFLAMLTLLVILLVLQARSDQQEEQKNSESLLADLSATWKTALESSGVSASRQVPVLLSLTEPSHSTNRHRALPTNESQLLYVRIDLLGPDGKIQRSNTHPIPQSPVAEVPAIRTALRIKKQIAGVINFSDDKTPLPAILIALRAPNDSILMAVRPLDTLAPILSTGVQGSWVLQNQRSQPIIGNAPRSITDPLTALDPLRKGVSDLHVSGRIYRSVAIPINDMTSTRIATLTSLLDVTELRWQQRMDSLMTLGLGAGLILLITVVVYWRMGDRFAPLAELTRAVQRISTGDLYRSVPSARQAVELEQIADAVKNLQRHAIAAENRQFTNRLHDTANLLLIESEMNRLRLSLGSEEQQEMERRLASEASGGQQLSHAFRVMVDQVVGKQTRLTDLLSERERDLALVREALAEKQQLTRLREELEIARGLQLSNLPGEAAMQALAETIDLYATMVPALEVGGDFYDFSLLDRRHLVLVIGDASGKGVSAAMFGMMSRTLMKAAVNLSTAPGDSMQMANKALAAENSTLLFATAFLGILDLDTGILRYASAGHNPPIVQSVQGGQQRLDQEPGLVLGAMEDSGYATHEMQLQDGDLLLLYTDGVTESHSTDKTLFGEERLSQTLQSVPLRSARDAIHETLHAVSNFHQGAPQFDDITLLAIRYRKP